MFLSLVPLLALGQAQLAVVDDEIRTAHNILEYHIAVDIPDQGTSITASTTIIYEVNQPGAPLVLDFDSSFVVDSIVSARGVRYHDRVTGMRLSILGGGNHGDTLGLTVYYHGTPTDGLFIQENVHGNRSAFADNWPDRAHHWFPSEDHPNDKAYATFQVDVPAGWKAIANGELLGVDEVEHGRTRWNWRTSRPVSTYNMVIGAGIMSVRELGVVDGAPQSIWTFPEDSAYAIDDPFRRAMDITRQLTDLIGPFPFAKLAHVESSTRFGGMENASAIFYNEGAYANRRLSEATVAHEIAHQWFGDAVTEKDWHHLWLSEGFASYFGPLYYELAGEDETFERLMLRARNAYFSSDDVNRPIIDPEEHSLFALLNRNNYQKGAWVLRMLRAEVGDDAFFSGIKEYYRTYRDSVALSADFLQVMERNAGSSLETFFVQWLVQPGYPQVSLEHRAVDGELEITVTQTQPAQWGLFEVEVPIDVISDGSRRRVTVPLSGRVSRATFPGLSEAEDLVLDPENTLLIARAEGQ